MTTMHALIMVFGAVMPAFVGLANWMIRLQVGAPDMALPPHDNFSFWILPFAFSLLLLTLLCRAEPPPAVDSLSAARSANRRCAADGDFCGSLDGRVVDPWDRSSVIVTIMTCAHRHVAIENAALRLDVG